MRKYDEKTIKKLKNKSVVKPIILFIILSVFSIIAISATTCTILFFIVLNRYNENVYKAYEVADYVEERIDKNISYTEILREIQNEEMRPGAVSVVDANGHNIVNYGKSIDTDNDVFIDINDSPEVYLYMDEYERDADDVNAIAVNLRDVVEKFGIGFRSFANGSASIGVMNTEVFSYDYWVTNSLKSGDVLYVKQTLKMVVSDCLELITPAALLVIIFVLMSCIYFINMMVNIHSQRYYLKLLLSDRVTGGDNELSFESFAFKSLSAFHNRKFGYGIVNISLMKYQKYCTSYGVEEGERLIVALERQIKKRKRRGEMLARVSGGDYLLLIRAKDKKNSDTILIDRVNSIIAEIPGELALLKGHDAIPGASNIKLKAGLYYLPPVTDDETKGRRNKKSLNIKRLEIKSGIAKDSLLDESGLMVYNHDMWEKEIWEQKVEDMMQAALENEEFQVYIQPKYHPATEKLMGGEALVRWISPTEGFISPGQFIPIFERTGFVTKLDDYMISHTAQLQAEWKQAGKNIVPISVNVSRAHFAMPDLAEHICQLVDRYPIEHKYIEIELTESAFFDDKKAILNTVSKLQEYGFEVSMDDFGAGYSSLNSLKDLPLNVLKLDGDFFRGDDFNNRGEIVVSEAIALAKKLNMRIVAEGVEKKEQVDFLATKDCDMIQGFYFAKPMPASEYEERM